MDDKKAHQKSAEVESAKQLVSGIDGLAHMAADGTMVLDGDCFTLAQLEAIVYLMRTDPAALP